MFKKEEEKKEIYKWKKSRRSFHPNYRIRKKSLSLNILSHVCSDSGSLMTLIQMRKNDWKCNLLPESEKKAPSLSQVLRRGQTKHAA